MVAIKNVPQTFNGIVKMLDVCSFEHGGCRCANVRECLYSFDKMAEVIPGTKGYKRKCYRFSKHFLENTIK